MKKNQLSTLLCGGALALSLAFPLPSTQAAQMAPTNPMPAPDALASTQWELVSPNYAGLDKKPTLKFANGLLNASVGLNRISSAYSTNGKTLTSSLLISTRMAGSTALMGAETKYKQALESVRSFEISRDGKTLSLRGAQVLTFKRVGKTVNNPLAQTQWQLVSPGYAGLNQKPALSFSDNRLNASVGLNQINGEYEVNDLGLKVSSLAATRMAGPAAVMSAETEYAKVLQGSRSFELTRNGQTLTLRGDKTLKFERVSQTMNDPLASTQWNLTSPNYAGLKDRPTLRFDGGAVAASVGLNQMGGEYQVNGQNISFGNMFSTKMAGSPAQMAAETQYAKALAGVRTFEISRDGNILSLRGPQVLTFERASQTQTMKDPLAMTEWELTLPVYKGIEKPPTLSFRDGSLGASVGLNGMGTGYKIDGNKITLEQFISTMMAGPPALMEAENGYKTALAGVRTFAVSPDGQTLTLRGDRTLTFKSKGRISQGFTATETKIINVEPQLGPDFDGDKTPKYLQLEDLSQGVSWGRFTEAKILGFDYQPGNRYQLRVQVERDAQSGEKQLRLLEVFSQQYVATSPLGADEKIMEVAPTMVDCVGLMPMKCLQVREVGGQWQNFYAPIEGFEFVEGSRYRLQVKVTKIANPPADASNLRYQLVRVLDKMPVTY